MKISATLLLSVCLIGGCSKSEGPVTTADELSDAVATPEREAYPMYPSIATLGALLASRELDSKTIATEVLARADKHKSLNAFITLDAAGARKRAAELDAQISRGESAGPLHGIPLVVKDNIHVAGLPNTAGTPGLKGFVPSASNEVVERLQAAGAIIIGKTNLHELAFGITSDNGAYGAVGNPYDPRLIPGGSSGGTAAAISAGIVPAGLGSDTGGSVRIPAGLTGIVGFRPTSGRYPSTAVTPISHTRDTVGLMARTVADLIALDSVIVPDGSPVSAAAARQLRIGVPRDYFYDNLDAEAETVITAALKKIAEAHVQLVDVKIPGIEEMIARSGLAIVFHEAERDLSKYLEGFNTGLDFSELVTTVASPDVKGVLGFMTGDGRVSESDYAAALQVREELRETYRKMFAGEELDAIIFPTTPLPARPIDGSLETVELNGEQVPTFPVYIRNTDPASLAALPGVSLPVGLTIGGLPVALEIDGPEGSDRQLLAVAKTLEAIFDFTGAPPHATP